MARLLQHHVCLRETCAGPGCFQSSRGRMPTTVIDAEPAPIAIDRERVALLIIDMQRDFLEPGGFGETLGIDVALLSAAIGPGRALLDGARNDGVLVFHTR